MPRKRKQRQTINSLNLQQRQTINSLNLQHASLNIFCEVDCTKKEINANDGQWRFCVLHYGPLQSSLLRRRKGLARSVKTPFGNATVSLHACGDKHAVHVYVQPHDNKPCWLMSVTVGTETWESLEDLQTRNHVTSAWFPVQKLMEEGAEYIVVDLCYHRKTEVSQTLKDEYDVKPVEFLS